MSHSPAVNALVDRLRRDAATRGSGHDGDAVPEQLRPSTTNSTVMTVLLFSEIQSFIAVSVASAFDPRVMYRTTGVATVDDAITTNTTRVPTSSPVDNPAAPTLVIAAIVSPRFFGLTADRRNPIPNDFGALNRSIACIQPGIVGCSPPSEDSSPRASTIAPATDTRSPNRRGSSGCCRTPWP